MHDNSGSLLSIIILLAIFVVIPYIMKILGRYTLSTKGLGDQQQQNEEDVPAEEKLRQYLEGKPLKHKDETMDRPAISNKPITPKWF